MFNASWIAPNQLTMKLSTNQNSNIFLENYPKLPQIPQRNKFLTAERPQFRIQQQIHNQKNFLSFQEIFEIDQKNKHLLKELINVLNEDLNQQTQTIQTYIQNQQDYEIKTKPYRIRNVSYDNNFQSDRSFEEGDKFHKFRKLPVNYKNSQLKHYSRTEKIHKTINANQEELRDSNIEFESKQVNTMKILNPKQLKINQKIHEQDGEIKQTLNSINESLLKKKKKFKIFGQAVFAAICLSKKYRMIQKKQLEQRNQINKNFKEYQKVIDKFSKRQAIIHEKQYYEYVVEKIMHYFKDQSFIDETQKIQNQSKEYQSDIRKLHVFKFTTLLLKNIELYTRQNTILDLINSLLNISLYQKTAIPISKFVGQRCNFYNDDCLKIPQDQLVLIALEYYFFIKLIPNLFEILNKLQEDKSNTKQKIKTNSFHLNECHFYVCVVATLLQQKIIQFFSELKKIKNPNGNIVQKTLKTTQQQNLVIKAQIVINNQLDNKGEENAIVKGLITTDLILALEQEKPQWMQFINQTFQQIIKNFRDLIPN
ncbi:unnamed protein product [Paramecium sonneborni]|uniref:Uncharacterized protein n=1 Tax=Paramecium sonneborni TaxID=65129 RepID=A0A8S1N8Q7_9CILI|nr:unnamed protein product [Paramecium sonneborni]